MPLPDLTTYLTAAEIKTLRAGYSNADMQSAARAALIAPYPRSTMFVNASIDSFFSDGYGDVPGELGPRGREQVVLGVLSAAQDWPNFNVHVYWGLCVKPKPLSPAEICEVVFLTSNYAGIDVHSNGTKSIYAAFTAMKACVAAGHTTSIEVVGAIGAGCQTADDVRRLYGA